MSAILAIALIACLVGFAIAQVLWSKQLPSSITITSSTNAELYNEVTCTTLATAVSFANFDALDFTGHLSNIIYMKYNGSKLGISYVVVNATIPSGFTCKSEQVGGTWFNLNQSQTVSFTLGMIFQIQISLTQTVAHTEGIINLGQFNFAISDVAYP